MAQICGVHGKEMNLRKGQYGDFWSCPTKNADGSWCKWKAPKPTTEMKKFDDSLNRSANQIDASKKDETITRLAIVKSFIESDHKYGLDTVMEMERYLAWVQGKAQSITTTIQTQPKPVQEATDAVQGSANTVRLEEIPF